MKAPQAGLTEHYVDTPQALRELGAALERAPWVALDTEFMREKSYHAQLCLLQVATPTLVACIDPLALDNLDPLLDALYQPQVVKVLHAARQDLEILYHLRGELPRPLFDTQLAATVLGYGDQIGYAALVQAMLGVTLEKAHTRTDWSQRPLDPEQIHYAADDVRYLGEIYEAQQARLQETGRDDWLAEDFAELAEPARYRVVAEDMWRKVSGINALKGQDLAVLRLLAAWREETARQLDKPRKWILTDQVLVDLARRKPRSQEELAKIRGLETGTIRRFGRDLLALIREGRELPREAWPQPEPRLHLAPGSEAIVDTLMAVVRTQGEAAGVSPNTLTSRRELERLVNGERDVAVLHGWRGSLCGSDLLAMLEGRLRLRVAQGRLMIEPDEGLD